MDKRIYLFTYFIYLFLFFDEKKMVLNGFDEVGI